MDSVGEHYMEYEQLFDYIHLVCFIVVWSECILTGVLNTLVCLYTFVLSG